MSKKTKKTTSEIKLKKLIETNDPILNAKIRLAASKAGSNFSKFHNTWIEIKMKEISLKILFAKIINLSEAMNRLFKSSNSASSTLAILITYF